MVELETDGGRRWEAPRWLRTGFLVVLGVGVVGALILALMPQPVPVDLVTVERGTVEVAVEEDGRTHVRDRYLLTTPVAGTLRRIELRVGDRIEEGEVLARIDGPEAGIPDARTLEQLRIRLGAAEAGVARARALVDGAGAGLVEAREELRRQEILQGVGGGTASGVERAEALVRAREAELRSAEFGVRAAEGEVEDLRAALARPTGRGGESLELRAPVSGAVLRLHRESGGAVGPGEPLVELGDPTELEVVVDLLSQDAVRVPLGAHARIRGWGGEEELEARVRRIEPSGFTRISALGIEEQRVNVILDPLGDRMAWGRLGDGFRVEARILVDRAEGVLRIPTGALFRSGEAWGVFRVEGNRAVQTFVEVGRRSQAEAEILSGLSEGDRVIVYPGDRVEDGVRVQER
jgi:HlyD family secretion protein